MKFLVEKILSYLPGFLKSLDAKTLERVAEVLGRKFDVKVPANVAGIAATVREWIQANPALSLVVVDVLSTVGFTLITAEDVRKAVAEEPGSAPSVIVDAVIARLSAQRSFLTGDGMPGTVHGGKDGVSGMLLQDQADVQLLISKAVQIVGSVELLQILRAVMFLEDADIDLYAKLNSRG